MINDNLPTLRFVVLAAGFSRRLGTAKALVKLRGLTLLERTLGVLTPFAKAKIIVVIPPRSARYGVLSRARGVTFVVNPGRAAGLSSSVRCGIRQARYSSAVMLLPVDLAELDRIDIARLISRWRGSRRAVTARRMGNQAATPLILPRSRYPQGLGVTGDHGLRELVRGLPCRVSLVDMPSAETDVDTTLDLHRARRRIRPQAANTCGRRAPIESGLKS